MGTQGGHDLGIDIGDTQIQRVTVGKVLRSDLDQGGRKALHNRLRAVSGTGVDHNHLARHQRGRIEHRRKRFADEGSLIFGANDDRNTRLKAQDVSPMARIRASALILRAYPAFSKLRLRVRTQLATADVNWIECVGSDARVDRQTATSGRHSRVTGSSHMVGVAQLVRASDCGSEGRRFEPGRSPLHQL